MKNLGLKWLCKCGGCANVEGIYRQINVPGSFDFQLRYGNLLGTIL